MSMKSTGGESPKFHQTFGERVLKMEHKNVKDMYQSISGADPFEFMK